MLNLALAKRFLRRITRKKDSLSVKASGIMRLFALVILSLLFAIVLDVKVASAQEFLGSIPAGGLGFSLRVGTDTRGDLYVLDFFGDVTRFDGLTFEKNLDSFRGDEGSRGVVTDISVDQDFRVYVAFIAEDGRMNPNVILKLNLQGQELSAITLQNGNVNAPIAVRVDSQGNIYVGTTLRILKFDRRGELQLSWGGSGSGDGEFDGAIGIAVDGSDNIYVADIDNHRIQVFDSNGNFLFKFGSEGSESGQFRRPRDVTVDSNGNIYVADTDNSRIQMFDSEGRFLRMWGWGVRDEANEFQVCESSETPCHAGIAGSGDGQFGGQLGLEGLAINPIDNILFAADAGNNRIQAFSLLGLEGGASNRRVAA